MSNLKTKKFFEKITTAIKDIDEIGQGAEIYGKNSAGTGDCTLQKQTYQNPLAGQCNGRLYTEGGVAATATTTTQSNDLFVVTPSTGKIKILKTGHYLVMGKVSAYTGFTAEDRLDIRIQVNGSNNAICFARERMSGTQQIICLTRPLQYNANDEINLAVTNYEAARGIVVSTSMTMLQIIRLGD